MCGICGYLWTSDAEAVSPSDFAAMTDSLAHRGPDDRGILYVRRGEPFLQAVRRTQRNQRSQRNQRETSESFQQSFSEISSEQTLSPGVALGHRRLSILDLSEAGRQPMISGDETAAIVFNGEIYNFIELRSDLEKKGHRFQTATDTEVLLHLYQEYGVEFPRYLNGMFAIGLWDSRRQRLVLVRDRFGKKPLYYYRGAGRFVFASELNTLIRAPKMTREIDSAALNEYLAYQYIPHPRSIYRGICKLPPASLAVWTPEGDWQVDSYWNVDYNAEDQGRTAEEWSEILQEKVENAVKIRLRSDVPLGAFLSGGVDSTIIVGLMQKFSAQKVKTFSIGFAQKEYDETPFARRTAQRLGTDHQEFFVTPNAEELFPQIVRQYGEPYADSSAIPTWILCGLTRQKVTAALSGDGGDELFAGYDRYKAVRLAQTADKIPMILRRFLAGPIRGMIPASTRQRSKLRRFKRFLEAVGMPPLERYFQWIAIFNLARLGQLASPFFQEQLTKEAGKDYSPLAFLEENWEPGRKRDFITSISLLDSRTYLPCDIMTKTDIASMRHSLEVRSPFLDREVAETAFRMPISLKMTPSKGKIILRNTFREFLPPELENRPKTGFGVPLDHWFRGPLKARTQEILTDSGNPIAPYFNQKFIDRLLREHFEGVFDHASRIWSLLVLYYWADTYLK